MANWQSIPTAMALFVAIGIFSGCRPTSSESVTNHSDGPMAGVDSKSNSTRPPSGVKETPHEADSGLSPEPPAPAVSDAEDDVEKKSEKTKTAIDWPNWMGRNYDGVSKESNWSSDWPEAGLPLIWTREIGTGFSSVSIASGHLYTMGHRNGRETVFCLNADTGEDIWTHDYEAPLVDNLHEGGPGSTPTVHGDYVYTVSKGGRLCCLRRSDGEVKWAHELQDELGVTLPEWGFNGSPYITGNQLILEAGRVVSFDKSTGEKLWQTDKHTAGYGSAIHFQNDGRELLATLDCDGLRIVLLNNGGEVAFYPWSSPFQTNSTTPIILPEGEIFISTGYNVGCGLFKLRGDDLELLYSHRDMRNHFNNSIYYKGKLYGFDGNSNLGRVVHLKCMDARTGEIHWKHRGLGCGSLMISNGRLILLSESGELVVAEATPESYRPLASSPFLEGRCWTVPVLLGGRVYGRNARGKLVCAALPASK